MIKKLFFIFLFILNIISIANADLIEKYFDYENTSAVTHLNLNGNIDNIVNVVNGKISNVNIESGFKLYEILGSIPAAGQQGRIIYNTTDNTLNFDTGSIFNKSLIYTGTPVHGDIPYYGSGTSFALLSSGTKGQVLTTGGSSANPSWEGMTTQGDIEYHNGTTRTRLASGTSGQFLKTQGASANPIWGTISDNSNVIFCWFGSDSAATNSYGMVEGTSLIPSMGTYTVNYHFFGSDENTAQTILTGRFVKISGVSTVTIHAKLWAETVSAAQEAILKVDIGGLNNTVTSSASSTPTWVTTSTIDVSSLTNGTTYTITISLYNEEDTLSAYCSGIILTGS